MKKITNKKIRIALIENDMKQWNLANVLGVSESTLSQMLRKELPIEKQNEIIKRIEEAK